MKLSIDLFNPKIQKEEVVIDTTVQEKNITYPTDSKLAKKVIDTCRNIAIQEGIPLRQSYSRVTPQLLRQASNRKSPVQKIKARKATRRLQTIGRALVRELVRKMPQKQISPYAQTLLDAWSILLQNKTDKHKIYSLHEPHVSCISKGKAHKPFEFGSKVSISRTRDSGILWESWQCQEILTMATRFKPPLSKSKESLENSRKSSSLTGVTKAKRNLSKPVC